MLLQAIQECYFPSPQPMNSSQKEIHVVPTDTVRPTKPSSGPQRMQTAFEPDPTISDAGPAVLLGRIESPQFRNSGPIIFSKIRDNVQFSNAAKTLTWVLGLASGVEVRSWLTDEQLLGWCKPIMNVVSSHCCHCVEQLSVAMVFFRL